MLYNKDKLVPPLHTPQAAQVNRRNLVKVKHWSQFIALIVLDLLIFLFIHFVDSPGFGCTSPERANMLMSMHVIISYFVEVECCLSMLLFVTNDPSKDHEDTLKPGPIPLGGLMKQNALKFTIFPV